MGLGPSKERLRLQKRAEECHNSRRMVAHYKKCIADIPGAKNVDQLTRICPYEWGLEDPRNEDLKLKQLKYDLVALKKDALKLLHENLAEIQRDINRNCRQLPPPRRRRRMS